MPTAAIPRRLFVAALALGTAVSAGAGSDPPGRVADLAGLEDLPARWKGAMDTLGVPGLAVGIVRDGRIAALEAIGIRNTDGDPVDPDTMFYIASCTKTYVAAALAALAEDRRVDLDAPVRTYLSSFRVADESATESITVRDLICHRPGLQSDPIVFLDAYTGQITEDRYYRWLEQVEPTGLVQYSNLHFTLAGRVIEAVTGQSWKDYLDERLFTPGGMDRTTAYAGELYADANTALPMKWTPDGFTACRTRKTDRTMHAAGGMGTTARDGAQWILLQLGDGTVGGRRVVAPATARSLRHRQSDAAKPRGRIRHIDGFGLGWMLGTYRGRSYAQHGGGYVGTAAHLSFLPEEGIGVVVLANAAPAGQAMMDIVSIDIYDRLLGEEGHRDLLPLYEQRMGQFLEQQGAPPRDDLVAAGDLSLDADAYPGRYENDDWGTLTLTRRGGELTARIGDLALVLVAAARDSFTGHTEAGDGYEGRFVVDEGRVIAVICEDEDVTIRFERRGDPG